MTSDTVHVICPQCEGWVTCPVNDPTQTGSLTGRITPLGSYYADGLGYCDACPCRFRVIYTEFCIGGQASVYINTELVTDEAAEGR